MQRAGDRCVLAGGVRISVGQPVQTADGLAFASQIYAMAKPGYHPITSASVEALLAKAQAAPAQ